MRSGQRADSILGVEAHRPCRSHTQPLRHPPARDRLVAMTVLGRGLAAACLATVLAASVDGVRAQPVVFRLGYGGAAEEPMWLLVAKPDLARNYGKAYTLDATRFTSSDKRAQAFEAGAIDLSAGSANGVIFAAAEGVKRPAHNTRWSRPCPSAAFAHADLPR